MIATEQRNPKTMHLDQMTSLEIAQVMNEENAYSVASLEPVLPQVAQAIDKIAEAFSKGGRLFYIGAGTSGRLAVVDASECPPTFSVPSDMVQGVIAGGDKAIRSSVEGAEDNFEQGFEDASMLNHDDVAVVISASGNPKYLLGVLQRAEEVGCKTIGITCNSRGRIAEEAGLVICVEVGPEVIAGSSRLKAGTAQKMILNMLSTGAMIKIGKTYENFMIDLQAVNE